MEIVDTPITLCWKWKSMEGLSIPREDLEELLAHLQVRNITPRRGEDSLIWEPSKIGQYNSKDGYRILVSLVEVNNHNIPLKIFWSSKITLKVGIFVWLAIQKKILTTYRFTRMGYEGPSRCILWKAKSELVDHLLLTCPFASKCWRWLCAKL